MSLFDRIADGIEFTAIPAVVLTKRSRHKWVRAAGQVATATVLLPYTIVVGGTIGLICFAFGMLCIVTESAVECVADWWRNV